MQSFTDNILLTLLQEDEDSILTRNKKKGGDGEQDIDVVTVQPIPAFCSRYMYRDCVSHTPVCYYCYYVAIVMRMMLTLWTGCQWLPKLRTQKNQDGVNWR